MAAGNRDYVGIATAYAERAAKDSRGKTHGRLIHLAAKRFLKDLKRAQGARPPFIFDDWHACDACDFIEKLPHIEGVWESPDIVLEPFQVFFVVQIFGFRNHDGTRRFTTVVLAIGRKNAKSTLAAGILLYCQSCENEPGAQIISAATTYSQAKIIFEVARLMALKTPDLREAFGLEVFAKGIVAEEIGSSFKAIHAKASTQDGLNPSHTAIDEYHAHKTPDLVNVLTSAAGARANPLWLYTTTEGYINAGPWSEMRHFIVQMLNGLLGVAADHFLALFFQLDDDDDYYDPSKWIKANPLIEANPHLLKAIKKEAVEAKNMPSKEAEFIIKRCNRQSSTSKGWIKMSKWLKGGGELDLDWLSQFPCTAGLDLASTTDFCSWRFLWEIDDVFYTWGRRWVPEAGVKQRMERGTVNYQGWISAGWLTQTPGEVTDYTFVEQQIRQDCARFNPTAIGFDPWNATAIASNLLDDEFPMIQFIQGPKSFHPTMQALERAYMSGKLRHGGDPVLRWCASNLLDRRDVNLNMAPDKRRSPDKIDDMVALLMAFGVREVDNESENLGQAMQGVITA